MTTKTVTVLLNIGRYPMFCHAGYPEFETASDLPGVIVTSKCVKSRRKFTNSNFIIAQYNAYGRPLRK